MAASNNVANVAKIVNCVADNNDLCVKLLKGSLEITILLNSSERKSLRTHRKRDKP